MSWSPINCARMERRIPIHVEGFTREIPYFMELADFFIGKPGPGQHQRGAGQAPSGDRAAQRLDHGRMSATTRIGWRNRASGWWCAASPPKSSARSKRCSRRRISTRFRERAAGMRNSAVYEIPDFLEQILSASRNRTQAAVLESA